MSNMKTDDHLCVKELYETVRDQESVDSDWTASMQILWEDEMK